MAYTHASTSDNAAKIIIWKSTTYRLRVVPHPNLNVPITLEAAIIRITGTDISR